MKRTIIFLIFLTTTTHSFAENFVFNPKCILPLRHTESALQARLQAIRRAEKEIVMTYFEIGDGIKTQLVLNELILARRRGVDVKIITDWVVSKISPHYLQLFDENGIQIKFYNHPNLKNIFHLTQRNHQKYIVVDRDILLIGGRNLDDRYFENDKNVKGTFYDFDLVLKGTVATEAADYFFNFWNKGYRLSQKKVNMENIDSIDQELKLQKRTELNPKIDFTLLDCDKSEFNANLPNKEDEMHSDIENLYVQLIDQAQEEIVIENAYVTLNNRIHQALARAAVRINPFTGRRVSIDIISNSLISNDIPIVYASFSRNRKKLFKLGVHFYEFPFQQTLHSKMAIFDKKTAIVGSFNLDRRASNFNMEDIVTIKDPEAASNILTYLEETKKDSVLIKSNRVSAYFKIPIKLKLKNFFNKLILLRFLDRQL